jgi:hypothetical protein
MKFVVGCLWTGRTYVPCILRMWTQVRDSVFLVKAVFLVQSVRRCAFGRNSNRSRGFPCYILASLPTIWRSLKRNRKCSPFVNPFLSCVQGVSSSIPWKGRWSNRAQKTLGLCSTVRGKVFLSSCTVHIVDPLHAIKGAWGVRRYSSSSS